MPNCQDPSFAGRAHARLLSAGITGAVRQTGLRFAGAAMLAAALSLALPVLQTTVHEAPQAQAKKRAKAQKPKKTKRQIERQLKRARARVIPAKTAAGQPGKKAAALTPPDSDRDGKPLTLQEKKALVLAAPPQVLRQIGRHVIVGYYAHYQLTPLLERGALGGVFVTARNARRRSKATLAKELAQFRALAAAAGQETFWLSADQEGGSVSRLSPPLPYQPSLRNLLRKLKTPEERRKAVADYAAKQARALAELGINLNFAPVADINHNVRAPRDRHTRIRYRAISTDPQIVAETVRDYCAEFDKAGVYCTLKHFPGIGRIAADTHVTSAHLKATAPELEATDWIPFRKVLGSAPAFVMVGHPHVASIDPERPASTSPAIIQKLLRDTWNFDGVIVTDDLAMGAIKRHHKGGMPQAAIDAINAGADIVLIGSDGDEVYAVLYALIRAKETGELDTAKLAASDQRLIKAARAITPAASNPAATSASTPAAPAAPTNTSKPAGAAGAEAPAAEPVEKSVQAPSKTTTARQ